MSKPKISVNKLGEYLIASPTRRKRIVEDQQEPKPFIAARYTDAREKIVEYLSENMNDDSKILIAAQNLRVPSGESDFNDQDRRASADAIEDFLDASENIILDGLIVEAGESTSSASMKVSHVDITMRPDALLKDQNSGEIVGCVKLHFPRINPLNNQSAEYVATAMRVYLENIKENKKVDPKKCYVVDVPTKTVVTAPKAFKRKMNDIVAACEEINARWRKNS